MSNTSTLRNYRATFVLDTRGYKEPVETLIEKLTKLIESLEGQVSKIENHGLKEFIRVTDRKFPAGIYVEFFMKAPGSIVSQIKEKLRLDRTIDRILIESI